MGVESNSKSSDFLKLDQSELDSERLTFLFGSGVVSQIAKFIQLVCRPNVGFEIFAFI